MKNKLKMRSVMSQNELRLTSTDSQSLAGWLLGQTQLAHLGLKTEPKTDAHRYWSEKDGLK